MTASTYQVKVNLPSETTVETAKDIFSALTGPATPRWFGPSRIVAEFDVEADNEFLLGYRLAAAFDHIATELRSYNLTRGADFVFAPIGSAPWPVDEGAVAR